MNLDEQDAVTFYEEMIPKADKIYDEYLKQIREENNG